MRVEKREQTRLTVSFFTEKPFLTSLLTTVGFMASRSSAFREMVANAVFLGPSKLQQIIKRPHTGLEKAVVSILEIDPKREVMWSRVAARHAAHALNAACVVLSKAGGAGAAKIVIVHFVFAG